MELIEKNYYSLIFNNDKEFFVESTATDIRQFIESLNIGYTGKFITLKRADSEPIYVSIETVFSVQKINNGVIGAQTKVWRHLS